MHYLIVTMKNVKWLLNIYKPEDNDEILSYIEDLNDFAHLLRVDEEEKELADDILSDIEDNGDPEDILSDDGE